MCFVSFYLFNNNIFIYYYILSFYKKLKKVNTGYNFAKAKTYLITQKSSKSNVIPQKKAQTLQENQRMPTNLNRQTSTERKEFAKISEIRYKKLLTLIEKYKQSNSSVNS